MAIESDNSSASFLPDFCSARVVFVVIILAELLAVVLTLAQPPYVAELWFELAMFSLFIQWVALSCAGTLCASRVYLRRLSDPATTLLSCGITVVVTVIVSELAWWLLLDTKPFEGSYVRYGHTHFLARNVVISSIVAALVLRYFYVQHQYRIQVQAEAEARFQALQSRIRPHFLFNCMNTIASLTRRDAALAEEVVEDLSDLFRATLQDASHTATLSEELATCRQYLRIEQHRLGERLRTEWRVDDLLDDVQVPALILQPLVENAVYHGIEHLADGGTIRVSGRDDGSRLVVSISNPVPPAGGLQRAHQGNRLAQENVRQRLAAFFGEDSLLEVEEGGGRYAVTVKIPKRGAEGAIQ